MLIATKPPKHDLRDEDFHPAMWTDSGTETPVGRSQRLAGVAPISGALAVSGQSMAAGIMAREVLADCLSPVAFQPSYMLQSEELRASLLARYPPEKLYQAERNFNAAQELDVSLLEGDLVGVIKKKDPMGSQSRWLIDNGGQTVSRQITVTLKEGKVPASYLGQKKIRESLIKGKNNLKSSIHL